MLMECSRCQAPVYDYMLTCRQCGTPNDAHVSDRVPSAAVTKDQRIEVGLLATGLLASLAAAIFILSGMMSDGSWPPRARHPIQWGVAIPLGAIGAASLLAYNRIDLRSWSPPMKDALWIGVLVLWASALGIVGFALRTMW